MLSTKKPQWIDANNHALDYFGGVPALVVCDNCKQAVIVNQDWIEPEPKFKSYVENATGILEKGFFHKLEERQYFSLEQFNKDLWKELDALNKKPFKKTYVPDGMAKDIPAFCKEYDQIIKDNPIDIQLLGIGRNGHIAFNEPGTPFDIGTHEVKLTENTIEANARFFDNEDEVPKSAICMGTANIMQSKKIVLMAFGEKKAQAIKEMIEGPVTEQVPASILQKHPDVTVIVDKAAAQELDDKYKN